MSKRIRSVLDLGAQYVGRWLGRYASVNVLITATGMVIHGLYLILSPHSSYAAPVYSQGPMSVFDQAVWGWIFVVAGGSAILVAHVITVSFLVGALCLWAALVLSATLSPDVAPSAWVWLTVITVQLLWSIHKRGITTPGKKR